MNLRGTITRLLDGGAAVRARPAPANMASGHAALSFEQRALRYQHADGAYLESAWDGYEAEYLKELSGIVWAGFAENAKGKVNDRPRVAVFHFGCSGGGLFRALENNLGHMLDFEFVGADPDWRALGFLQAKMPKARIHAADIERLEEVVAETGLRSDICIVALHCYSLGGDETRRLLNVLGKVAPKLIVADQIDNFDGRSSDVKTLKDYTDRSYDAVCHPFGAMFAEAGFAHAATVPAHTPFKSISGFVVGGKEELPAADIVDALVGRARKGDFGRPAQAPRGPVESRINDISFSIDDVVQDIKARGLRSVAVYGDESFYESFARKVDLAIEGVTHAWFSSNFSELEEGAQHLNKAALNKGATNLTTEALQPYQCIVVGGPSARLYHPRLLRLMGRAGFVVPVFPVGNNWEFCVSQIGFPAEVDDAQAYLFNHFQEYFGVRDPILARIEIYDQNNHRHEDWILLQPNENIRIDLNERLPERNGPSMITVFTTAPVLTRGRHYRWRFCIDAMWKGSLTTLHGSHDIRKDAAGTEFIQARSAVSKGQIVFTLPNHYADMSEQGIKVECVDGDKRFVIERDRTRRIEQVAVPGLQADEPRFGDFVGCKFHQYTTPFWFAMEERDSRPNLSGNHIQGHTFDFLTKAPPTLPRGDLERSLSEHDIITWPYGVPVLPPESGLEMGFSFDSSWPVIRRFVIRFFDRDGAVLDTLRWTKDRPGLVFTDELSALSEKAGGRAALLLVSPDWETLDIDQQANGVSPIVDFSVRSRKTGDYDITEFQNCWRNLGVVIREMPHWIHFSNHLLGGTNLYGRALVREGWRCGALLVNGSGNLRYDTDIDFGVKVFNRGGELMEAPLVLKAFTHKLVWLDEVFPDLGEFLGPDGFGAMVIRSKSGDLNGQLITTANNGETVSLQHMWGY